MFIHHMPIWATSKDCPVGTFNRVALFPSLSLSLSAWVTVALLWPSLLHLSPCQHRSFIYRKAFTQINTAPLQLPCTHTHSHTPKQHLWAHTLDFGLWSEKKQNTSVLGSPVCLISVFLFVDCSHSTHIFHFSSTSFLTALLSSSIFPLLYPFVLVRKQRPELQEVVWGGGGREEDEEKISLPLLLWPPLLLRINRCFWVSPCGCCPGSLKGEPNRASPSSMRVWRKPAALSLAD